MDTFKNLINDELLSSDRKVSVINLSDESTAGEVFFCNREMINYDSDL